MDEGARFHVVSQLIREIVEGGKAMLATSLMDKDKPHDDVITASDAALHSLLQQDRILAAVCDFELCLFSLVLLRLVPSCQSFLIWLSIP
jgi:hypothetical protein